MNKYRFQFLWTYVYRKAMTLRHLKIVKAFPAADRLRSHHDLA